MLSQCVCKHDALRFGGNDYLAKQHSATPMLAIVTVVGRKGMITSAAVESWRAACACRQLECRCSGR